MLSKIISELAKDSGRLYKFAERYFYRVRAFLKFSFEIVPKVYQKNNNRKAKRARKSVDRSKTYSLNIFMKKSCIFTVYLLFLIYGMP